MAQWGVTIGIPDALLVFRTAATEERPTQKLNWKTDSPVWVEQWPLSKEKLKVLQELVDEQLAKGHIVETTSLWNSPVFVIKKIPLHPDDAPHFIFTVPTLNRKAPRKRYHCKFLPQGVKNSPSICQWHLPSMLSSAHAAAGEAMILHYMDDVLMCAPNDDLLSHTLDLTIDSLVAAGFELQEEKIQRMAPWKYQGLEIGKQTIVPQKLAVKNNIKSLPAVQQLCGSLNWVRPWLDLITEDLDPLFNLSKGGEELSSPRTLTQESQAALEKVQDCMAPRQANRCKSDLPFKFIILGKLSHLHRMIFQWENVEKSKKDKDCRAPLLIIEWVFLSHHRSKRMTRPQELVAELIQKARTRIRELAGCDFECIHIPIEIKSGQITKAVLEHLIPEKEALQFALDSYTDSSRASHKSVIMWKNPQTQQWEKDIFEVEGSPQVAELAAVVRAFEKFPGPFKLITGSAYVAGVVSKAEQAVLSEVSNAELFNLLSKLVNLISHREQQFYVMHIRSHTDLPGFITKGNRKADALAASMEMAPLPDIFGQAKISYQLFHQNAPGLVRQFHLSPEQAWAIVSMCPLCQQHAFPALSAGANPRGLNSCEVWQTDMTHSMSFGRQRYIHVSVDTFSGAVYTSAHTGEKSSDAMKHLIQAFSFLGIPKSIKTDNGPTYTSKEFRSFLQQWEVFHEHVVTLQSCLPVVRSSLQRSDGIFESKGENCSPGL
ncbi:hypothetical protein DUI87_17674 [Hirundo rustica rustica]|uniref:Uncharacterized protein n=1 Tax=Hirundo rustica rustica TaxID=333673 RepID=A0A3M0JXF7_HIRRU|nr:hypothetical protein DUI87_17674 [Hirundo rustica rustica]